MPVTPGSFRWYAKGAGKLSSGLIAVGSTEFRSVLMTSGYTPDANTHEFYNLDISNELATANGYTQGGTVLQGVSYLHSGGKWRFQCDPPAWQASGGPLAAYFWAVYANVADVNKPLVCFGHLNYNNGTPQDVTATDGNHITLLVDPEGLFTAEPVDNP